MNNRQPIFKGRQCWAFDMDGETPCFSDAPMAMFTTTYRCRRASDITRQRRMTDADGLGFLLGTGSADPDGHVYPTLEVLFDALARPREGT